MSIRAGRLVRATVIALVSALFLVAAGVPAGAKPNRGTTPPPPPPAGGTLVLYDTSGQWGHFGELYAIQAANLASHFGAWTAKPVSQYTAGMMSTYDGVVYLGSTYGEALPAAFLTDVKSTTKPVLWGGNNIWQLDTPEAFTARYGWRWTQFDPAVVTSVSYRGQSLLRNELNGAYSILGTEVVDATKASVLADAVRPDATTFPYAVRSANLTYLAELPFAYATEGDRVIVFQDLLFDLLAPTTATRHRALVRLEDLSPTSDPAQLMAIADYLHSKGVPFGFGMSPLYLDPTGYYNGGVPENVRLRDAPHVIEAVRYLQSKGGVMVEHGYSHQYEALTNPYNGVSGDDYEFYRVVENADHSLTYVGPVDVDSPRWVQGRIDAAAQEFRASKLATPTIFEFPHYAGSDTAYRTVAQSFTTRWERGLYYGGTLSGQPADHSRMVGQYFPYVVKDVYGTKILPENLGDISPDPWYNYPAKLPPDLLANAQRNLAIRDGFASFFFHPFLDISYLKTMIEGMQAQGWTFVSPASL